MALHVLRGRYGLVLLLVILLVSVWHGFGLSRFFSLATVQAAQADWLLLLDQRPVLVMGGFFAIYVAVTALSLPGAAVMTLLAGALFGVLVGTLLVSFASTLGAVLAMLMARYVLGDWFQQRFATKLATVNAELDRQGVLYLLSLRLAPVFPFFLVNILMGLSRMPLRTYAWASQLGMLPGTVIYVNAGTQLAALTSLRDVLSPALAWSLVALAAFPWASRYLLTSYQQFSQLKRFKRPSSFDRNLIVIGAGAAGLVTSYIAAAVKAKVTLIEKARMGGDCLNEGCVPSKALIRCARVMHECAQAQRYGLSSSTQVRLDQVMQRVRDAIQQVAPHDSVERYQGLGVDVQQGTARLLDPWTVAIQHADGQETTLTARNIVLATGAKPRIPDLPGLEQVLYFTSETLWQYSPEQWPMIRSMVVLGGGPIGCELAMAFARLGLNIHLVHAGDRLLPREDADVADLVRAALERAGVRMYCGHRALSCEPGVGGQGPSRLNVAKNSAGPHGVEVQLPFDALLVATGRVARREGLGLEGLGIRCRDDGTIETNAKLQTHVPTIYACGDATGPYQFTHVAAHQAWYAAVNSLFMSAISRLLLKSVDYRVIPWVTFVDPEVARVGLSEHEAKARGIAYDVTRFELHELDRAITEGETEGFVKVLTVPGRDKILGVVIVAQHAGELIAEFVLAMKWGLGLNKLLSTIHAYPTWVEANKYAAGVWKRAHVPHRLLAWVERFHAWRRA